MSPGLRTGGPGRPRSGGNASTNGSNSVMSTNGSNSVMSFRLAAVSVATSGIPCASVRT
jgi:hypothetical protein